MRWLWALLVFVGGVAQAATPVDIVKACLEDATAHPDKAADTIYFYQPGGYTPEQYAADTMHANLLSKETDFGRLRVVNREIVAAYKSDYGWDSDLFDKLAFTDPYFHEVATIKAGDTYDNYWRGGQGFKPGWYRTQVSKEKKVAVPHRVLLRNSYQETRALYEQTNSNVPVLRADWFFFQTAACEDRVVGYYEVLGLKNRADAEELAGLDRKIVAKRKKQQNAYLVRSNVALNNRSIEWMQAYDGDWWLTKDSFKDTGKNNVVRLLNGDLDHDAEEIYGTLPNGLPLMIASDKNGVLQRIVPAKIALNKNGINNDLNLPVPFSCMHCHVEVVRPFSCDGRKLYQREIRLETPDYFKLKRLQQLYLSDIDHTIAESQRRYAQAIKACNGLVPAANASAYADRWRQYLEVPLGPAEVSVELGIPQDRVLRVIDGYIKAGLSDPVLSGLGQKPPVPLRREQWEEAQGLIWEWIGKP